MMDAKAVDHVARLGRLDLTPEERERLARQLGGILAYIEKLKELPTEKVEPLVHAIDARNAFRDDAPRPCLSPNEALAAAPDREADFFKVPRVIE